MDESPIQFDMPSNQTVAATGTKTVKIRNTGNEKNRLTVILACTGDGSKLKLLVIFKRKTVPKKLCASGSARRGMTFPKKWLRGRS